MGILRCVSRCWRPVLWASGLLDDSYCNSIANSKQYGSCFVNFDEGTEPAQFSIWIASNSAFNPFTGFLCWAHLSLGLGGLSSRDWQADASEHVRNHDHADGAQELALCADSFAGGRAVWPCGVAHSGFQLVGDVFCGLIQLAHDLADLARGSDLVGVASENGK